MFTIRDFKVGQRVKLVEEPFDTHHLLTVGYLYEIVDIDEESNCVQLWLNEGETEDEDDYVDYWVSCHYLAPKDIDINVDKSHPNWKVILKVKQMQVRRQINGYAF